MDLQKMTAVEPVVNEDAVEVELSEFVEQAPVVRDEDARWSITSRGAADWAMEKLAHVRAIRDDYEQQIDRWKRALQKLDRAAAFFEGHLERWALATRSRNEKSFPLAHGNIKTSDRKPTIQIGDEEALIEWAREVEPDLVETTEKIGVMKLRKVVELGALIVEWEAINKTTGEVETVPVHSPERWTEERQAEIEARMGDEWQVTALTEPAVFHGDDPEPVPGTTVADATVSVSVSPYLP